MHTHPEALRNYAESLAWHQLARHSVDPFGRQITVAFGPTSRTNLEALTTWIYFRVLGEQPQMSDLTIDSDLSIKVDGMVRDCLDDVFAPI